MRSAMAQEDLLKQGQRIWEMLDEMAATNPEGYKKFIKKQMTEGVEVLKPPQPVMGLHCKTAEGVLGSPDLYINVCSWQHVPKPKSDHDPIPVKGGTLRKSSSKTAANVVQVFDLAFNPSVTDECCKSPQLEHMLIELCLDYVEKQAGLNVVRKSCCKIKELCYGPKQDLQFSLNEQYKHMLVTEESKQEIKLPGAVVGEDDGGKNSYGPNEGLVNLKLGDNTNDKGVLIEEVGDKGEVVPVYTVTVEDDGEVEKKCVVVKVDLPNICTVSDVDLEINENVLELEVPGLYAANIAIKEKVDEDNVKATFDKSTRVLLVKFPVL